MRQQPAQGSSRSSSEIVKVESLTCSSVTSGDEQEELVTSTSSDIEVFSSRGHTRGGSDQSSCLGEEVEFLRRRDGQLEELVAAREARLVTLSQQAAVLQGEVEEGRADRIVAAELRRRVALLEAELATGLQRVEARISGDSRRKHRDPWSWPPTSKPHHKQV